MKSPIFALFVVFMKSRISAGVGSFNKADTIVHEIQDKKMNDFNPTYKTCDCSIVADLFWLQTKTALRLFHGMPLIRISRFSEWVGLETSIFQI